MSKRTGRVASTLQREIQRVLAGGLQDPRLEAIITVLKVDVDDDLRDAVVHVSILPEERSTRVMHALRDASAFIRREASNELRIRRMPGLIFKLDTSLKRERAVLEALRDVEQDPTTMTPEDSTTPTTSSTKEHAD